MSIDGNIQAIVQVKDNHAKNKIGECVPDWVDCLVLSGWLDLSGGDSKHSTYNAKIQESTHIFLCDYQALPEITSENARMVIGGNDYEILLIDNPLQMNRQLEFYLKYTGGGLGVG